MKRGQEMGPGRSKTIRDPVHKDIELTERQLRVIDTPQVQRLRGIRQLGGSYLVYPGAHHTRFEHALGTCWMARRILASVEAGGEQPLPETERQAVLLTALLHDVTHIPFGHTFEDERKLMLRHDESQQRYDYFFGNSPLGEILRESEPGRIALELLSPEISPAPERKCLAQIVSGTICADLLDYLKRDNYYCGLSQEYDDRLFRYFTISGGRLLLKFHHQGLFRRDALTEVTNLLRIRYVLSERVYYHHAKIAFGAMISRTIEAAIEAGLEEADLFELTDHSLLYFLREKYGHVPEVEFLLDRLRARQLYKRCYMLSREIDEDQLRHLVLHHHENPGGKREETEAAIADALGGRPVEVAIYCAPEKMALKEAHMPVIHAPGETTRFADLNSREIRVLQDQHRALWKFYVFVSPRLARDRERCGRACEEIIGVPNQLPTQMRGMG